MNADTEILMDICEAAEETRDALRKLLEQRPEPVVVPAPTVTVQAPSPVVVPAPEVNVPAPPVPRRWIVEVLDRDHTGRIEKLSIQALF